MAGQPVGNGGDPRPAIGKDIGESVIVRYDEKAREVVGLTIIGLMARITKDDLVS